MQHLKENIQNNEIVIKVNNKDAQKQISQIQKQIDSLQEKINARQIKLNIIASRIDEIIEKTTKEVMTNGGNSKNPETQKTINSNLLQNKEYSSPIPQEITMYNEQLSEAKNKISQLKQEITKTVTVKVDKNGDIIVQNLANAFNNLLGAINNVVQSEGFQSWLKWCSDMFREITEKIVSIDWQPFINGLTQIGTTIGSIALEVLSNLVDIFKWLIENQSVAEILLAIAIAIGIVSTVLGVLSAVMTVLTPISTALGISIGWLVVIIVGIIAVITLIVLAIMNWDIIMKALADTWNWICEVVSNVVNAIVVFIQELWNNVSFIFEAIWEVISTILGFIWNMFMTVFEAIWNIVSPILNAIWQIISTIFQAIWNIISSILGSIWNVFSQVFNWIWELTSKIFQGIWNVISPIITAIWEGIKTALSGIQQVWSTIWNTVSNVVRNVWNGIWSCIKGVINTILGGIEGFVNGVIKGINFLLSGISSIANAVGSLIGLSPINLKINTISLPRLAKGGVLTKATAVIAGEYSGASTNPEIVTPQNIMEETFDKVMSRYQGNNNEKPIYLTVNVSNKKLGHILLDDLRDMKRQTGNGLEALVGG